MKDLLEATGFLLIVTAAYTVALGLALLVAGVGLIALANAPETTRKPRKPLRSSMGPEYLAPEGREPLELRSAVAQ